LNLEKLIKKNKNNSKVMIHDPKDLIIEQDPIIYGSENNKKGINLNIKKYMMNTFNKSRIIARNSSGIV